VLSRDSACAAKGNAQSRNAMDIAMGLRAMVFIFFLLVQLLYYTANTIRQTRRFVKDFLLFLSGFLFGFLFTKKRGNKKETVLYPEFNTTKNVKQ
jgi:hypothetical protein